MPKLIYFQLHAKVAKIRILLSHSKADHEEEALSFEEFGPRKAAGEFNNGQVPVWIENGKQYNESNAILRLLGKRYGYYPTDPEEAYHADNIVDFCSDLVSEIFYDQWHKNISEEAQAKYVKSITHLSTYLEKQLSHGKKFVAGDSISIGDFAAAGIIFSYVYNDVLSNGTLFSD